MNAHLLRTGAGLLLALAVAPALSAQTCDSTCQESCCREQVYDIQEIVISSHTLNRETQWLRQVQAHPLSQTEDLLRRMPGVALVRRGNFAMEPVYRGLNTRRLSITVDGMRIQEACTDKMDPVSGYIEPNNLSGLELNSGINGYFQGSSSGANLNVRLATALFADSATWLGGAAIRGESVSQGMSIRGLAEFRSPDLGFRASAVLRQSGNYRAGGGEEIAHSQFHKANYSLSSLHKLSPTLRLQSSLLGDHAWQVGYPALPMDVAFAHSLLGSAGLMSEARGRAAFRWNARLYASVVQHAMDDTHREQVAMHMDMPGETKVFGAFWQGAAMWKGHQVEAKGESYVQRSYAEMTMYPGDEPPMFMLTWPDVRVGVAAISLADKVVLGKGQLQGGFRLEGQHQVLASDLGLAQIRIFYPGLSPQRFTILAALNTAYSRPLGKYATWKIGASWGQRAADVSEQTGYYLFNRQDNYDYLGNPLLAPEQSVQVEANFGIQLPAWQGSLSGYVFRFQDYILARVITDYQAMTIGASGVKVYENVPAAWTTGLEGTGSWAISKQWQVLSTASVVWGCDNQGEPLPQIAPFSWTNTVRYQRRGLSVQGEWQGSTRQLRYQPDFGEVPTAGYHLIHLRLSQQMKGNWRRWQFVGGAENLLDARYRHHLDWGGIPQPGRNVYLGLSWR